MIKKSLALLAMLLAGCASTPATHFYVLEAVSQPAAPTVKDMKKRLIGVGPITLPPLLDRKQIVTRTLMNGIDVAEFHQWAAPLKDNVLDVLTQNLTQLQPENFIRPYPWSAYGTVNYRVLVDITRFDTRPGIAVNFEATWAIMDESNHKIIDNGRSKISHALIDTSYPASVHALSQVLGQFCSELSVALQKL
ncbi:PqiC family protein [Methylovulum psychrotolerans]|jgi:hypothetical protein|uniref:ABC-type transport auxiliary lipoprotein component domain-containing protein n=1 Tax=Methylovulum psychrotolerans TaxID=1704499 RepID=A0A1Z4BYX7_9GAMM|nr:PqiC family protein [Methylovulum psychrotolerans]ASF46496.1 hypothetical protein CEK71_10675 [Methylovulum psychrotolerans]MBT9097634.1 membrane integrity-associated transporter subunit PqiC [Methylovulum psychrotolerans]